jgi:hypothetical protein
VDRLIEANGGTAEGLDLSDRNLSGAALRGVDLSKAKLQNAILVGADLQEANLQGANFQMADLRNADLSLAELDKADLINADLRGANLSWADLQGAWLYEANLQRAWLIGTNLQNAFLIDTHLGVAKLDTTLVEGITWAEAYVVPEESEGDFGGAEQVYRALKRAHQNAGIYDLAGAFHYREWVCRRKQAWKGRKWLSLLRLLLAELVFGYGERPWNLLGTALLVFLAFAAVYWFGGLYPGEWPRALPECLYFSAASFTALGYAGWVDEVLGMKVSLGWPKYLGPVEAVLGVFIIALFLVTSTRRWTRKPGRALDPSVGEQHAAPLPACRSGGGYP